MGSDFEVRGRSAPSVETAVGIQTAAMFVCAFMLLLARTDDAGLIARAVRAWIALIDPYVRWITFFGSVPTGGPDGQLAIMHRHLLVLCVVSVAVFLFWSRRYLEVWTGRLFVKLLRVHHFEARVRRFAVVAQRQAALGVFGGALVVILPDVGSGVGWYFFLAPLASGAASYCLAFYFILGGFIGESPGAGEEDD